MILDCASPESTRLSLQQIVGLSEHHVLEVVSGFDLDQYYAQRPGGYRYAGDVLLDELVNRGGDRGVPQYTCWFHATRTMNVENLRRGVRPLPQYLEQLWSDL